MDAQRNSAKRGGGAAGPAIALTRGLALTIGKPLFRKKHVTAKPESLGFRMVLEDFPWLGAAN
jgi:hypothetical protein